MGEPQWCWLRWHNYSDSVISALESLRYDEDFLDVTIACDGHTVKAHKLVLSASSTYFRKVLKDHPCDHPIVILDGLEWEVLVPLLHFMYCGEVVVEDKFVPKLLSAATNLDITGLTHVTNALINNQTPKSDGVKDDYSDDDCGDSDEEDNDDEEEEEVEDNEEEETEDQQQQENDEFEENELVINLPEEKSQLSPTNTNVQTVRENDNGALSEIEEPPPSKRPRTSSTDTQIKIRVVKHKKDDLDSTKTHTTENGSAYKITNGMPPVTLPNHVAKPLVFAPSSDTNSIAKKCELDQDSLKNGTIPFKNNTIMHNGISVAIKNDDRDLEEEYDDEPESEDSNPPKNGDTDILKPKFTISLTNSGKVILPEGLLDNCMPVGLNSTAPINYAALLNAGGTLITPTSTPVKSVSPSPSGSPVITSSQGSSNKSLMDGSLPVNIEKVVQQVLLPSAPSSGSVSLTSVPTLTSGMVPATAPVPSVTSSNTITVPNSGQQYIQPSLVSLQDVQATLEQYQRKLAFHEPRPCPTCKRMYRDAATLRTHMAIMHSEGKEPFSCTCGALFRTKYDMYQHKKNGHR